MKLLRCLETSETDSLVTRSHTPEKTGSSQMGLAYKIIKPGMVNYIYTKWHAILYQVRLTFVVRSTVLFFLALWNPYWHYVQQVVPMPIILI
jgi:hypothetical protein